MPAFSTVVITVHMHVMSPNKYCTVLYLALPCLALPCLAQTYQEPVFSHLKSDSQRKAMLLINLEINLCSISSLYMVVQAAGPVSLAEPLYAAHIYSCFPLIGVVCCLSGHVRPQIFLARLPKYPCRLNK
ncbi:hypothetical protein BGZ63DRAFT_193003 [Mariannaea sp. PMI_226]|nr:hypothetical protein BGZ63DRAFT_193003 [Mariannaea sp. PMI_226]